MNNLIEQAIEALEAVTRGSTHDGRVWGRIVMPSDAAMDKAAAALAALRAARNQPAAGGLTDTEIRHLATKHLRYQQESPEFSGVFKFARAVIAAQRERDAQQRPVAAIYVSASGDREFDDWKVPLPTGRNELYPHPAPQSDEAPPASKPWYFNQLQPCGTLVAIEPSGVQHVVKGGQMGTEAGRALFNRMVEALSTPAAGSPR